MRPWFFISIAMRILKPKITGMVLLLILLLFSFCDKTDDTDTPGDPSGLAITVLSIDDETGEVVIQASANDAVRFELYIEDEEDPAATNQTGTFEYTFAGLGEYLITIRAYGSSGRYISQSTGISINPGGGNTGVPLSKGYFSPLEYAGYTLIWQDEFNGNDINTDYWSFDIGDGCPNLCGWGNNELEYYRAENARVAGETLIIEAKKEAFSGSDYTSAKLITRNKFSFQYGRIDIRALLPKGQGMWPALWMLGNSIGTVGWPKCGEIDIMEMIGGSGRENTCYGTLHWDNMGQHASFGGSTTVSPDDFTEAYHVFSIIWNESKITWYVDNDPYHEMSITDPELSEFQQEFWLIFNVAVGGNWPGNPDGFTVFPQQMKVDYVRVFQVE